jgi:hypothetical protein
MQRAYSNAEVGLVSEMAIVDTFTKLIFGEDDAYSARELRIIQAFRSVDTNVALDSHHDMGGYLRAMGVREMVQLVTRVQQQFIDGVQALPGAGQAMRDGANHLAMNRRTH